MSPTLIPPLRPAADLRRRLRSRRDGAPERRLDPRPLKPRGEEGGGERVAGAGGVDRFRPGRFDPPAPRALGREAAGRAALDHHQRLEGGKAGALGLGIG